MTGGARNIACLGTRYDVLCTMLWKRSLHLNFVEKLFKKDCSPLCIRNNELQLGDLLQ